MICPLPLPHMRPKPISLVVGEPLWFPKTPHPTGDELKHWQGIYITAVKELYDESCEAHGASHIPLELF